MEKLRFFVVEGLRSLWRNRFMTIAALITTFLSMLVLGLVLVFAFSIDAVLRDIEQRVEVSVYLLDGATPDQVQTLRDELEGLPEVKEALYISKDEALERFRADMSGHPEMIESLSVEDNPLPASFEISLTAPEYATAVAERFTGRPGVDEVRYGKEVTERLLRVTSAIRNVLLVFIVLLAAVAVLLISNTIRLSIFARRREVEIMQLVGATHWFIRWPFLLEGLFVGVLGAVAALFVVLVGSQLAMDSMQRTLLFLTVPLNAIPAVRVSLILLLVGAVIGALGSALGLRRFLGV